MRLHARSGRLTSLTALTAVAVLAMLTPAAANDTAEAEEPVTAVCRAADTEGIASGEASRSTLLTQRLRPLGSLVVTGVRVSYASGARCDVFLVDGRLPFGQDMKRIDSHVSEMGLLVVAGADQGETENRGLSVSSGGTPQRELDDEVLGAVVYAPSESGTMPALPGIPTSWQGQPYTFTHTRSTAEATLRLRKGVEKRFTVTPATRAAAARRLRRELAVALFEADRRDARKTYRLALRGIRLVMKPFTARWSGELPG